jgi:hypothetical protein
VVELKRGEMANLDSTVIEQALNSGAKGDERICPIRNLQRCVQKLARASYIDGSAVKRRWILGETWIVSPKLPTDRSSQTCPRGDLRFMRATSQMKSSRPIKSNAAPSSLAGHHASCQMHPYRSEQVIFFI